MTGDSGTLGEGTEALLSSLDRGVLLEETALEYLHRVYRVYRVSCQRAAQWGGRAARRPRRASAHRHLSRLI